MHPLYKDKYLLGMHRAHFEPHAEIKGVFLFEKAEILG
jgi:hypothetical protein